MDYKKYMSATPQKADSNRTDKILRLEDISLNIVSNFFSNNNTQKV